MWPSQLAHERERAVAHRARMRVQLRYHRGEEAAARVDVFLHVPHVVVDEGVQPLDAGRSRERRVDHLLVVEGVRGLDRRELQLLLGAEVGEQAALAHPHGLRQAADGEPADALDGDELSRRAEDRLAAALTVAPALPGGSFADSFAIRIIHLLDNLARPFVSSTTARTIVLISNLPERNDR